ncbi:MAG: nitroreductase [Oleiphilaceae bacterium]|jgi:nitroreductase
MKTSLVELLCQRVSFPRLTEPAPNKQELDLVLKSALRAPDHMRLRPWRYLIIEGDARHKLGELFLSSAKLSSEDQVVQSKENPAEEMTEIKAEKFKSMPMRAPMLIVAIASLVDHPKVPHEEQMLSCGVGVGYMLLALQALGYGGVWRTGDMALDKHVCEGLGLKSNESIISFLYIGTPVGEPKPLPNINPQDFFSDWK